MFVLILVLLFVAVIVIYYLNENVLYPQKLKLVRQMVEEQKFDEALNVLQNLPEGKRVFR